MKKVYINGRFLSQPITGVQRYSFELILALDQLIDSKKIDQNKYKFIIICPKNIKYASKLALKHIEVKKVGILNGQLWEQLELPIYCLDGLLICLSGPSPLLKKNKIVTVHDLAIIKMPKTYSFLFRTVGKIHLDNAIKTAKRIITVSTFSKSELLKYNCNIEDKINVIHEGKEHVYRDKINDSILKENNLQKKKYVLAVSSMSPNKNFKSIAQAIEIIGNPDFQIVIVGGANPKVFSKKINFFNENIKYLGYVTDEELRTLYENAGCFIFPSFYEGFGLPPLEAMACGCPVIVSNTASLPEVCGEAALYCDPNDPLDIAKKVELLMSNSTLQETMKIKGAEQSNHFSWEKCGLETFQVIKKVLV